jgi:hypothetical protein
MTDVLMMIERFFDEVPEDPARVNVMVLLPYMEAPHLFNVDRATVLEQSKEFRASATKRGVGPEMMVQNATTAVRAFTLSHEEDAATMVLGPLHALFEAAQPRPEEAAGFGFLAFVDNGEHVISGGEVSREEFMRTIGPLVEDWRPVRTREAEAERIGFPRGRLKKLQPPTLH